MCIRDRDEDVQSPEKPHISSGRKALKGSRRIMGLAYNKKHRTITSTLSLDSKTYDTTTYEEDEPLGLLVRVKTFDGLLIASYRDGDAERADIDWIDVEGLTSGNRQAILTAGDIRLELASGDSINKILPVIGRDFELSVKNIKPKNNNGGVIAELGGGGSGLSLYIKDRKVIFSANDKGEVKSVETPLPLGEFNVVASLNKRGLSLITGSVRSKVDSSITGLTGKPKDSFTIGSPGVYHVTDYGGTGDFEGEIEKVTLLAPRKK